VICKCCSGKLKVKHSYGTPSGKSQRLECEDCFVVHTAVVAIVNVDPERGQGAHALAKRLAAGEEINGPWTSIAS